MKKGIILGFVVVVIVLTIIAIEKSKPNLISKDDIVELGTQSETERISKKEKKFERAKEFIDPSDFINTEEFRLDDLIGEKVILLDFWTYSCINCQRTFPYLNGWYEKYKDSGLEIVGVHAPEFAFEKKYENVKLATEKFDIKFPVVLDNDFLTWQAYRNHHWPHKYLIDIDGFIVYDHIGEGRYEETEIEIQNALQERKEVLELQADVPESTLDVEVEKPSLKQSPEIYFGSARNKNLGNVKTGRNGKQNLDLPENFVLNKVYLQGEWNFGPESAQLLGGEGKIIMRYHAKNVFMVASSEQGVEIEIFRDGKKLESSAGRDLDNGKTTVKDEKLYNLINGSEGSEEHILEIKINNPGFKIYTFTFG